ADDESRLEGITTDGDEREEHLFDSRGLDQAAGLDDVLEPRSQWTQARPKFFGRASRLPELGRSQVNYDSRPFRHELEGNRVGGPRSLTDSPGDNCVVGIRVGVTGARDVRASVFLQRF